MKYQIEHIVFDSLTGNTISKTLYGETKNLSLAIRYRDHLCKELIDYSKGLEGTGARSVVQISNIREHDDILVELEKVKANKVLSEIIKEAKKAIKQEDLTTESDCRYVGESAIIHKKIKPALQGMYNEGDAIVSALVKERMNGGETSQTLRSMETYLTDNLQTLAYCLERLDMIKEPTEIEEKVKAVFGEEDYYKEIAWHCYVTTKRVGEAYEGMRADFDKLWGERKEYLVNKVYKQIAKK